MFALQVRTGRIFCVPDVCQDDSAVHNEGKFCGWRRGGLWLPNISRAPINSSIVASAVCTAPLSLMDNQRTHCESYMAAAERKRKKLPELRNDRRSHRVRLRLFHYYFTLILNTSLERFLENL